MSYPASKKLSDGQMAFQTEFDDNLKVVETAVAGVMAGDVVSFNYQGSERLGLVVKSRRTDFSGSFKSTRGNTLLNVFLLNSITNADCRLIINTLYRNRIRSTYVNSPKILSAFLGKENFRTFNVGLIADIRLYLIIDMDKVNKEPEEPEEDII